MNKKCVWAESSTNKNDLTKKEMPIMCKKIGCDGTEKTARLKGFTCFTPLIELAKKDKKV